MEKPGSSLIQIRNERLEKVRKLKELGINPYPSTSNKKKNNLEIIDNFNKLEGKATTVAGRLMSFREHGKLAFGHIQDQTGKLQLYIREDELNATSSKNQTIGFGDLNLIDVGDIVEATGTITKTQRGEISILVSELKILTKSIRPLPAKHEGIKDKETLFRQRYLDMIMNPEKKWRFEARAKIEFAIREFLNSKGFLEIKTPIIQPLYGGGTAKPFTTHVNALDVDYYMAISHELYLKRLIISGFENVYNIVGYFRNEGIDRTHNPEFSMLETMTAFHNYEYNMDLIEEMYKYIGNKVFGKTVFNIRGHEIDFGKKWPRIMMIDAVKKYTYIDFDRIKSLTQAHKVLDDLKITEKPDTIGECMVKVFEERVEEHLIEPTFIYGHPVEISPLAKRMDSDSRFVERFEIFIGGIEGGDNWTELNDPVELFDRFKDQMKQRDKGVDEFHPMDIEFIEAMEYGMPPTTGLGPGIERLTMMFTETEYIDDVTFFPLQKPAQVTKLQKEIYGEEYLVNNSSNENNIEIENKYDINNVPISNLIKVDKDITKNYPGLKTGYLELEDINISKRTPELEKIIRRLEKQVKKKFKTKADIKSSEILDGFRIVYEESGVDPRKRLNSAESLIRRIVDNKGIYEINNLVDLYNSLSASLELPMAAYDLDQINGVISLSLAKGGEKILRIGEKDEIELDKGEIVYKDSDGVICMDFNYRDANRTKITDSTKKAVILVDGHQDIAIEEIRDALIQLASYIDTLNIAKIKSYGLVEA